MCGVVGILAQDAVNQALYDALTVLQHRGQDAAGMMTCQGSAAFMRKGNGLVREVISPQHMLRLKGNMGLGHVRYPTTGSSSVSQAQPFYVNAPYGIAVVHNGNLTHVADLKQDLMHKDLRHLNTDSDSELILNVFAVALQRLQVDSGNMPLSPSRVFSAVQAVYRRCQGAYAVVMMIMGHGMVAFRDPYGIRPLVMGTKHQDTMFASESVALDALDYDLVGDIMPGEAVYIDMKTRACTRRILADPQDMGYSPCMFEYIYLARPDSLMDGISVYQARLRMGEQLAEHIRHRCSGLDIDVVIPIPETSRTAALPLAMRLGVPYREGFVKNRYIGRTFIMPGQEKRRKSIKQKLNAIPMEFEGKSVLLVDDSMVRGNTSKEVIAVARKAGAKKVYFASVCPKIQYPNVYGIDMPAASDLVANQGEDIAGLIGADGVIYQDIGSLYAAMGGMNPQISRFEDSVFTGNYITSGIDAAYLKGLAQKRTEKQQPTQQFLSATGQIVEISNQ